MGINFFNVLWNKQTYLNMFYLLLSFPLGLFYFVFLITGISLGFGLIITLFGIPLLIFMTFLWYWIGLFEGRLSSALLDIKFKPAKSKAFKQKNFFKKIKTHIKEPITWKSLAYLLIKYPFGILSFVLLVVLISVSLGFVFSPIIYYFSLKVPTMQFMSINGVSIITNYWQVSLLSLFGMLLFIGSLHLFNGLANISKILVNSLLGKKK